MPRNKSRSVTEQDIDTALASEASTDDAEITLSKEAYEALLAENAAAKAASSSSAETEALRRKIRRMELEKQCVPTVIGGSDGVDPSSIDIVVASSHAELHSRLVDIFGEGDFGGQIAFLPIPVWPIPQQSERNPYWERTLPDGSKERLPNYDIGRTQVRQSLATVEIASPKNPSETSTFSIQGFGTLTLVSHMSPEEVADSITRRELRTRRDANSDTEVTGEDEGPAFTPSDPSTHSAD